MAKLTRRQSADHRRACDLVASSKPLTDEEKEFVLDHWREAADVSSPLDGAFFTPAGLARDMTLGVRGPRIIDLCAGIGRLAYSCPWSRPATEFVCVERNPLYVEVGKRIMPEAEWITTDVTDLPKSGLGRFTYAVSNPPYGRTPRKGNGPRYRGPLTHFHVIDVAADLADHGVFLIPQTSAPFIASGRSDQAWQNPAEYRRFVAETGIDLYQGLALDTAHYEAGWHGVAPRIEIVEADFTERTGAVPCAPRPGGLAAHRNGDAVLAPAQPALF